MSDVNDRKLFIVTFVVEDSTQPNGQRPRALNVPAFVVDWDAAADRANKYLEDFANSPEANQLNPGEKLKLQSIMLGGTILL